ncbi:MAG TPA: hypothetical protein PKJ08_12635, partial [Candidatus Cloacimonadota bacterium]|nr:hypothetical protein [Candidatus Cloacimonadota bacterium]
MKSLYELIEGIYNRRELWDYYEHIKDNQSTLDSLEDILSSADKSKNFIDTYLVKGKKDESYILKNRIGNIIREDKAIHTFSIFFLGIYLYENVDIIKKSINKKIKRIKRKINKNTDETGVLINTHFSYIWFLICFYHDIACDYEDNTEKLQSIENFQSVSSLSVSIPEFKKSIPDYYQDIWKSYFLYRLSCGKIDHGIFGGLLFYNDMRINYENTKKQKGTNDENFELNGVYWSKEILEEVHAYVAWVIMAHNIWYIDKTDQNYAVYQKFGLD